MIFLGAKWLEGELMQACVTVWAGTFFGKPA
jgi:hypothetical protein